MTADSPRRVAAKRRHDTHSWATHLPVRSSSSEAQGHVIAHRFQENPARQPIAQIASKTASAGRNLPGYLLTPMVQSRETHHE
jgi:hypothetical protein